ncbi:MAG TPA: N-methyl-L-tryptophan oxidase [Candidatus Nanopelagicales bacterium]|nr:N-methyl-L-tryptophan oxidase [Candidatus Nanopelagicales bacterium]
MASFDTIVIGLGGMGSAACLHLAGRGSRVLGLEQYGLAHDRGSSHGETRIVRRAYLGSPELTQLLCRSYALWDELERDSGQPLFCRTGLLYAAVGESPQIPADAARVATERGVGIELLDPAAAAARFPGLRIPRGARAFFEPDAGYVAAEAAVEACCRLAEARGADLRFHEEVRSFGQRGRSVFVTTTRGEYQADALVVTAGPWTGRLLADLGMPLVVQRIPQLWFPVDARRAAAGTPCFCFEMPHGFFYGVPAVKDGRMKICGGGPRYTVDDPSCLDRALTSADLVDVRRFIAECVPGVPPEPALMSMCMCTMTPDERFVVDRHPAHERITFAAGFSGQGFKLCPAVGELLAALASHMDAAPPEPFRLRWGHQRRDSHTQQSTDR